MSVESQKNLPPNQTLICKKIKIKKNWALHRLIDNFGRKKERNVKMKNSIKNTHLSNKSKYFFLLMNEKSICHVF